MPLSEAVTAARSLFSLAVDVESGRRPARSEFTLYPDVIPGFVGVLRIGSAFAPSDRLWTIQAPGGLRSPPIARGSRGSLVRFPDHDLVTSISSAVTSTVAPSKGVEIGVQVSYLGRTFAEAAGSQDRSVVIGLSGLSLARAIAIAHSGSGSLLSLTDISGPQILIRRLLPVIDECLQRSLADLPIDLAPMLQALSAAEIQWPSIAQTSTTDLTRDLPSASEVDIILLSREDDYDTAIALVVLWGENRTWFSTYPIHPLDPMFSAALSASTARATRTFSARTLLEVQRILESIGLE